MILKVLLVILVIAVIYFVFIKQKPQISKDDSKRSKDKKDELKSNDMVECTQCGVFVSIEDTILSNNKYYCSQECLEKR